MAARDDAERLLGRMEQKTAGWKAADLRSLYTGFGFDVREGACHTRYRHATYRELRSTVRRHPGDLPPGYVSDAIKTIRRLLEREAAEEEDDGQEKAGGIRAPAIPDRARAAEL